LPPAGSPPAGIGDDGAGQLQESLRLVKPGATPARPSLSALSFFGEGVLEGELGLGVHDRLVGELGFHQRLERRVQLCPREACYAPQELGAELPADDRGRLQHGLLPFRQPVDAGGQHGLHGRRNA
jgi:hypothetical protein